MHKDSRLLPKGRAVGLGVLKRVLLIVLALAVASIFLAVSGYDPLAILKGLAQSMTQDLAGTIRWSTAMILAGLAVCVCYKANIANPVSYTHLRAHET